MKKLFFFLVITMLTLFSVNCGGGSGGSQSAGQLEGVQDLYNPEEQVKPEGTDGAGGSNSGSDSASESKDTSAPFITSAKALSNFVIRIDFNEEINDDTAKSASNYSFKSVTKNISAESVVVKSKFVEVTLKETTSEGVEYEAIVRKVSDTAGNAIDSASFKFIGKGVVAATIGGLPANGGSTNSTEFTITVTGDGITAYQYDLNNAGYGPETNANQDIKLTDLQDGTYIISIIVQNDEGVWQQPSEATTVTWTVDTGAPTAADITISSPNGYDLNNGHWNKDFINIEIGGDVVAYKYQVDGGAWIEGVGNIIEITNLSDSTHNVNIAVQDSAGNWSGSIPAITNLTIDTVKPVALITNINTPPYYKETTITFVIGGEPEITGYKYILNTGSEVNLNDKNAILTGLSQSTYTIKVAIKDKAGNWSDFNTYTFHVDLTKPDKTSLSLNTSILPGLSNSTTAVINLTQSDSDIVYYSYQLDDGAWSGPVSIEQISTILNLNNGNHTINIVGIDLAGNQSDPITHTWTVDTKPPVNIAITLPIDLVNGISNSNSASIVIGGSDVTSYKYMLNDGTWSDAIPAGTLYLNNLPENLNTLKIIVADAAGNWTDINDPYFASWTVDTIAPTSVAASSVPPAVTSDDSITIGVANPSAQGIVEYKYQLDNGTWSDWITAGTTVPVDDLGNGTHTVNIIARDLAGNESASTQVAIWEVNTSVPTAVAVEIPPQYLNSKSLTIDLVQTGVTEYKYSMNNGYSWESWTSVANPIVFNNMTEKLYEILIVARNNAGTEQAGTTKYSWTVDTTVPVISLTSDLAQNPTNLQAINIAVNGSDFVSYEYSTDGVNYTKETITTKKISYSNVPQGNYTVYVKATDIAGNVSNVVNYNWTVDITPPSAPSVVDGGAFSNSLSLTTNWTNSTDVDAVRIQVSKTLEFNSGDIIYGGVEGVDIGKTSTYEHTANANDGDTYYFRVKVRDAVGNWSAFGAKSDGIKVVGKVTGKVVNTNKVNLAGALVILSDGQQKTTNNEGKFTIDNVGIGNVKYSVAISMDGYTGASKNSISVYAGKPTDITTMYLVSENASKGYIKGALIDANDGADITGYNIRIIDYMDNEVNLDSSISAFQTGQLSSGSYNLLISKAGYNNISFDNIIVNGDIDLDRLAMCEILPQGQVRVIVQWGLSPRDIDFHMAGPTNKSVTTDGSPNNRFKIGYVGGQSKFSFNENAGSYVSGGDSKGLKSTASIVQDDTSSYGPESINLFRFGSGYAYGTYTYTLYNWSTEDWTGQKITARVYTSAGLESEEVYTPSSSKLYLKLMQIDVLDINTVNVRPVPSPYQTCTLDYTSKSSMDWSAASSGIGAYLLAITTDYTKSFSILFVLVFISFISLYLVNRRRHRITQR